MMAAKKPKGAFGKPNMFARKANNAEPAKPEPKAAPPQDNKPIWMQDSTTQPVAE